jgi:hypothetical protein
MSAVAATGDLFLRGGDMPSASVFDREWRMACDVRPVSKAEADPLIRKHYLGKWPGVCVLRLGLICRDLLLGVCVYSLPPRETIKRYGCKVWELARLWIDDAVPRNAETFLIGRSVRYIARHFPDVAMLISYADPSQGHSGLIYRAANWTPDGRTDQDRKSPRFDLVCEASGKKFGRASHVPSGVAVKRLPRVSKHRFIYKIGKEGPA